MADSQRPTPIPTLIPTLIKGGRLIDPSQGIDGAFDLLLENGVVRQAGEGLQAPKGAATFDARGKIVTPGWIDIHVHLREPGQEYKETVESGTMAAAAGGFTAVACMANTDPVHDNRTVTELIMGEARRCGYARVYPIGAVSKGLKGEELAEIAEMVAAGTVAISDDGRPVMNAELMRRALLYARHFDVPVIQHAEDLNLSGSGVMHEGEWSTKLGLPGIPGSAEDVMVARDILLTEDAEARYHVAHLSTARSLDLVRQAKAKGLRVTCEVAPHHLLLTDEEVAKSGFSTQTKMKPPLRAERDRLALLRGIADGSIDAIASDHAPHHADEKDVQFSTAPFGILGLETTMSLCLDRLVRPGLVTLPRLVELLTWGPAKCLNLPGGSLAVGRPADVTILDLEKTVTVSAAEFLSKARNTPFDGWTLTGGAVATFLGGRRVELPER